MGLSSQKMKEEMDKGINKLLSMLNDKEKSQLDSLAKQSGIPAERIVQTIFYSNASQSRIESMKNNNQAKEAALLKMISEQSSELGDYREIKQEFLPLVRKIRNPANAEYIEEPSQTA